LAQEKVSLKKGQRDHWETGKKVDFSTSVLVWGGGVAFAGDIGKGVTGRPPLSRGVRNRTGRETSEL